jgi:hypothetical protein
MVEGNFLILGPGDVLIIYINLFITYCLKKIEKDKTVSESKIKLLNLAREMVPRPSGIFLI